MLRSFCFAPLIVAVLLLGLVGAAPPARHTRTVNAPIVVPFTPAPTITWDGCPFSGQHLTVDHYGSAPDANSAAMMAAMAAQFKANSYNDSFIGEGQAIEWVNDVPASQPTVPMASQHTYHPYPPSWNNGTAWPIPPNATGEFQLDPSGDASLHIVQHTSPCTVWTASSFHPTTDGSGNITGGSSWTAGHYSTVQALGQEAFAGDPPNDWPKWNGFEACPDSWECEGGAGPTGLDGLIPGIKWEDIQSGAVQHTMELILPPCAPAPHKYVYPADRAEGIACGNDASVPYGAVWLLSPNAPCVAAIENGNYPQSKSLLHGALHYGFRIQNTTGSTPEPTIRLFNGVGVRYPNYSAYNLSDLHGGFGQCHLLTDGYLLPMGTVSTNS